MDKIIRKIIKEELGLDDFEWTKQVDPFEHGSEFDEDDICFDSDADCVVNINKDNITFKMTEDEFFEKTDSVNDDSNWIVKPILYYGRNYDGADDYFEFDYDEFNYSGHRMGEEVKQGFQEILNLVGSDKNIEDFIGQYTVNKIEDELKYPPLKSSFDDLRDNYLSILGYQVQANRWRDTSNTLWSDLDSTGVDWYNGYNTIEITIPKEKLEKYNFKNLTELLIKVSEPITDVGWYDYFYDSWDSTGSEDDIEYEFNRFIENSKEILEEEGVLDKYKDFENLIKSIGFSPKKNRSYWGGYSDMYELSNDEGYWFIKEVDYDKKMVTLSLYEDSNIYNTPKKSFRIPFNKISDYVNNYRLNLESKNRLSK